MSNNIEFGIVLKSSGGQAVVADAKAAQDGLSGIKNEADKASASADKLSEGIKRIGQYAVAYLGVSQIASYGREILNTALAQDRFNSTMAISTGAASNAAAEYIYIEELSRKLGLQVQITAGTYASWTAAARGTSLEGERSRAVFESVSNVVAKMNLSGDESQGVFLALTQMMSKGVVSAEEFRQQLGERLPIATTAGAKALGVTTAEFVNLLNSGKILSEDFLPKFAASLNDMSGGGGPVDTLNASLNRLDNDFTKIRQSLGQQVPIKFVVDGMDTLLANTNAVAAGITGVTVAATTYGSVRMGSMALEAVAGMRAKTVALVAERAATLAAAEADAAQAEIALVAARSNNTLGLAHAQVAAAETAHAAASARLAAAQTASAASAGVARGALALIGGPIGAITLLLSAGAAAWAFWGSSAKEAANQAAEAVAKARQRAMELGLTEKVVLEQEQKKAIAERDALSKRGASGAEIKAKDDIAWAMSAAIEMIAIREKNLAAQAQGDSTAWTKLTQTRAQQRDADIADLNAEYLKKIDVARAGSAEMLQLAEQYKIGLAKINEKYKAKQSAPGADKNQGAVDSLEGDAFRKQMEAMGVSAAQVKVYELAMNGATEAQIASAQAAANQIAAIEAEKRAREDLIKATERQAQLDAKLANDRAGLDAVKADVALADPSLQGDSRIELERARAQDQEDALYQIKFDAFVRENEALTARGQMTEQAAATQAQRLEVMTELHEQRKALIAKKHMTAKEQFEAMSWDRQASTVATQMERMTQVGATKYRAMFEINKAAAKAKAVVNIATGVTNALSDYPFPLSLGMAGLVVAEGAAQLSAINGAQFGGGAPTAAGVGATGGIPSQMPNTSQPVSVQPSSAPAAPPVQPVNVYIQGNVMNTDFVDNTVIPRIYSQIANADVTIIDPRSRQAQMLAVPA